MPVLTLAMVCSALSSFLGSVYVVTYASRMAFRTAMAGAVMNIALNLLLIPSQAGIQGAAAATFISCLAVFLIRAVSVRRLISFDLCPLRCGAALLIIAAQAVFMVVQLPLQYAVQAAALAAILYINRVPLRQCMDKLSGYIAPRGKHLKNRR